MDDAMSRIADILSDEESLRQLSELAEMFGSGTVTEEAPEPEKAEPSGNMPDLETLMKLMGVIGAVNGTDKNTELLLALRPHLGEEAQNRLDKAVKLLKIAAIYEAVKNSGLLNNMF